MNTASHHPKRAFRLIFVTLLATTGALRAASPPVELPSWEQLSPAQREVLSTPIRERWNQAAYEQRLRWLRQAERWQNLSPEERRLVLQGIRRYRNADPETRARLRDIFEHMSTLPPSERKALREKWRALSPEQRRAWMQAGGPGVAPPPTGEGD